MLISMLGKTNSRKSNAALENEIATKRKKEAGVPLSIDEKRAEEA